MSSSRSSFDETGRELEIPKIRTVVHWGKHKPHAFAKYIVFHCFKTLVSCMHHITCYLRFNLHSRYSLNIHYIIVPYIFCTHVLN